VKQIPLHASDRLVRRDDGANEDYSYVCVIDPEEIGEKAAQDYAILFAAAPDLLAACESLMAGINNPARGISRGDVKRAEAAIKKAKGE
jgi:hypothetical protein